MNLLRLSQSSTMDLVACFLPAAAAFRPAKQVQSAIQQLTDPPLSLSLSPLFLTLILSDLSAEIWGRKTKTLTAQSTAQAIQSYNMAQGVESTVWYLSQ